MLPVRRPAEAPDTFRPSRLWLATTITPLNPPCHMAVATFLSRFIARRFDVAANRYSTWEAICRNTHPCAARFVCRDDGSRSAAFGGLTVWDNVQNQWVNFSMSAGRSSKCAMSTR
jgi:hypothetical protein